MMSSRRCRCWRLRRWRPGRDCHMGSSLFCKLAQLSSLHSRYSHQTPREGMRSLSGGDVIVEGTIQDDSMMQHFSVCDGDGSRRTGAALITFKTESSDRAAIVERWYSGLRNRCPDAQHIPCSRPHTAAAADHPLSSERTSSALR